MNGWAMGALKDDVCVCVCVHSAKVESGGQGRPGGPTPSPDRRGGWIWTDHETRKPGANTHTPTDRQTYINTYTNPSLSLCLSVGLSVCVRVGVG